MLLLFQPSPILRRCDLERFVKEREKLEFCQSLGLQNCSKFYSRYLVKSSLRLTGWNLNFGGSNRHVVIRTAAPRIAHLRTLYEQAPPTPSFASQLWSPNILFLDKRAQENGALDSNRRSTCSEAGMASSHGTAHMPHVCQACHSNWNILTD